MNENAVKRGFRRVACGFIEFNGVMLSGLHPSKISVSESAVEFDYTVGGKTVTRRYGLTRSDGRITSVVCPDGSVAEVVGDG